MSVLFPKTEEIVIFAVKEFQIGLQLIIIEWQTVCSELGAFYTFMLVDHQNSDVFSFRELHFNEPNVSDKVSGHFVRATGRCQAVQSRRLRSGARSAKAIEDNRKKAPTPEAWRFPVNQFIRQFFKAGTHCSVTV